jgi:DNA-binding transcriptional MocR family regulator
VINPADGVSRKRAVADDLRRQILDGSRPPSSRFPSERDIQQTYDVGRDTAREAMAILAREGLIVIRHGFPSRVRDNREMAIVPVPGGDYLIGARGATAAEAAEWGVAVGSHVLQLIDRVTRIEVDAWPADRHLVDPHPESPEEDNAP